jgi:hypothetical protein
LIHFVFSDYVPVMIIRLASIRLLRRSARFK